VVDTTAKKTPKTFVLKTGKVGLSVKDLKEDFKKVMEPNTATKLKVRKRYYPQGSCEFI
jgi:ribosome biogenesis protein SSF1/2